jgi:transcriptional regulator with XRE-family HTH domain
MNRIKRDMTVADVATRTQLSWRTISCLESGEAAIEIDKAALIFQAINADMSAIGLLSGITEPTAADGEGLAAAALDRER